MRFPAKASFISSTRKDFGVLPSQFQKASRSIPDIAISDIQTVADSKKNFENFPEKPVEENSNFKFFERSREDYQLIFKGLSHGLGPEDFRLKHLAKKKGLGS
jgi:hypothetical protein